MTNIQFQLRRGIASDWTSVNPILAAGEVGVETDTNKIKIGNGNSGWISLAYVIAGSSGASGITGPYVTTFNGLTGAVTGVCASSNNTFSGTNVFTAPNTFNAGITVSGKVVLGITGPAITMPTGSLIEGALTFTDPLIVDGDLLIGHGVGAGPNSITTNIAVGSNSLVTSKSNALDGNNIVLGQDSLSGLGTGSNNIAIGPSVMGSIKTGYSNIGIGTQALINLGGPFFGNSAGNSNIAIGYQSGAFISTGSVNRQLNNSILIGTNTKPLESDNNNTIIIGHGSTGLGSNSTVIGTSGTTLARIYGLLDLPGGLSASFLQSGLSAMSRTIDSIFKNTLSVKDFGAVGDGSTDDTTALQNALNAGASGCVYFPQGTYKITAGLTVSANTTLRAYPRKAIINVQPFSTAPILGDTGSLNYNNGFVINGDDVIFDGLWIKGSNEAKYRNEPGLTAVVGATGIQWRTDEYAAAIKAIKKNNIVVQNCIIEQFGNGIFFNGGNNYKIIDNFFFGGRQIGAPNKIANTHSIWMSGSNGTQLNKGFRGIISRNHCLSNTDSGIAVGIEGGDADVIISENICEPFQLNGIAGTTCFAPTPGITLINGTVNPTDPILTDPACNKSRYPIIVSYSGDWPSRIIVSNNIVRNGGANGIYANSGAGLTAPGSEVVITGNIVTSCGFDLLQPTSASLKGGIWINSNGGKTVTGNLITDCAGYGINIIGPDDDIGNTFSSPVISGNSILRTVLEPVMLNAGYGISVTGTTVHSVLVSSNRIYNSATDGIFVNCSGISSGNCQINDNLITHGSSGYTASGSGITVIVGASSQDCFVANNKIMGRNNVDSNGGKNAGIWMQGRVHCVGNSITRFHRGIESQFNNVRTTDVVCSNNTIKDTVYAITGQGSGPWLISGNVFKNITSNICHAGPFQGTLVRATDTGSGQSDIIHVTASAIPDKGIWVKGDYVKNSNTIAGSPKGWYCTVSGTGTGATWVSEGDLTPLSVHSIRGLTGTVGLSAGTGITLSTSGNTLIISSTQNYYVSVKDYGALGDGITNDGAALQNALNSGSKNIYFPSGTYKVRQTLSIPKDVSVFGDGPNLSIIDGALGNQWSYSKPVMQTDTSGVTWRQLPSLVSGLSAGNRYLNFSSPHGLTYDDMIWITGNTAWSRWITDYPDNKGEFCRISLTEGTTGASIQGVFYDTYQLTGMCLYQISNFSNSSIKNIGIKGQGIAGSYDTGLMLRCVRDTFIENVKVSRCSASAINLHSCFNLNVNECMGDDYGDAQYGLDYGIAISNCQNLFVNGGLYSASRHAITQGTAPTYLTGSQADTLYPSFGIITRNASWNGTKAVRSTLNDNVNLLAAVDNHPGGEYIKYSNMVVEGAFAISGNNITIDGCRITGQAGGLVFGYGFKGADHTIINNEMTTNYIYDNNTTGVFINMGGQFMCIGSTTQDGGVINIQNNIFKYANEKETRSGGTASIRRYWLTIQNSGYIGENIDINIEGNVIKSGKNYPQGPAYIFAGALAAGITNSMFNNINFSNNLCNNVSGLNLIGQSTIANNVICDNNKITNSYGGPAILMRPVKNSIMCNNNNINGTQAAFDYSGIGGYESPIGIYAQGFTLNGWDGFADFIQVSNNTILNGVQTTSNNAKQPDINVQDGRRVVIFGNVFGSDTKSLTIPSTLGYLLNEKISGSSTGTISTITGFWGTTCMGFSVPTSGSGFTQNEIITGFLSGKTATISGVTTNHAIESITIGAQRSGFALHIGRNISISDLGLTAGNGSNSGYILKPI